ncbi:hypothetical protein BCR36DRAFT_364968 [Piromyces finnis]|uniref:RING-type domain-containing protein n=1 Tax=Piromyces finnis TaxID=1754191 RepID=A0A1Y1UL48_9FUNG|nr:hypothetical protein BCR36DRAFT_364968 [Piromyces finnis]|eukprot:ORX38780.1 hypothetical protein BCR36DRAFT_364968 [Piromyces finnis]
MNFKESLILLPRYFISRYFCMAFIMSSIWLYLRQHLPAKRPQKLTIIDKLIINLPILASLFFIAHNLYIILLEEDNTFFLKFISIINFNKIANYLPTPLLELLFNNKYMKVKLDSDEIFTIYYMVSCVNAIKNLILTWYQKGNAGLAIFEVDFETSLLLYYNRSGPTLMIFFMRAFFSLVIFSTKVFGLHKYLLLFMTLIYRSTDFYYFIYHIYSKGTGYPMILAIWRIVEFTLLFSTVIYFLFLFLKHVINNSLREFAHIIKLMFKGFSLKDDCHTILFKLAEQTLRNEGNNGYCYNINIVSLPMSYYWYDYYKRSEFSDKPIKWDNKNINDENSKTKYDMDYLNKDLIQKRIKNSNFIYKNWANPNYKKYRNIYNPVSYHSTSDEYEHSKMDENNATIISNKEKIQNNLFNLFSIQNISSIIKNNRIFSKNSLQTINNNNNNNNNNIIKSKHFLEKNWKTKDNIPKVDTKQKIKYIKNNNKKSISYPLNQIIHYKNYDEMDDEYSEFLYNTYSENEDDNQEDLTYTYEEPPKDTEESSITLSDSMNNSKDNIYHELYDILNDSDVINNLKNQNIIAENNSFISNSDLIGYENERMVTRSKYRKLLNSDTCNTETEDLSSQTISENIEDSFKYQLPLRDTLAKASAQCEIDLNTGNTSDGYSGKDKHKIKWKSPILKKFNPFSHHNPQEESSSNSSNSYCSENTNNNNNNKVSDVTSTPEIKDPYQFYRRTCVVCFDAQREIILWPCGCLCLCDDCREMMTFKSYNRCPCCQQNVNSFSKINLK